jgi:hypothetical protein
MQDFVACRLNFNCVASTAMALPRNKGSMLRGAFFGALRRDFCLNKTASSCLICPAAEICPVSRLAATVDKENPRGEEIVRPFALEPIISDATQFGQGELFSFSITLLGKTLTLFPYTVLAVQRMGEFGIGNREVAPGLFCLQEVTVTNPLLGVEKNIFNQEDGLVRVPDVAITHNDVLSYSAALPQDRMRVRLITPLRLVLDGKLVHRLTFQALMRRLLRRLTDLHSHFCEEKLELDFHGLLEKAERVRVADDKTYWVDLSSYSRRRQTSTPIGGLVGEIVFEGGLQEFLPFLVWGQFTHVGKDATKGNGWYQIVDS